VKNLLGDISRAFDEAPPGAGRSQEENPSQDLHLDQLTGRIAPEARRRHRSWATRATDDGEVVYMHLLFFLERGQDADDFATDLLHLGIFRWIAKESRTGGQIDDDWCVRAYAAVDIDSQDFKRFGQQPKSGMPSSETAIPRVRVFPNTPYCRDRTGAG
jgi:hypothetical protein